jgi:hypothetical protein
MPKCIICDKEFQSKRSDARTCSDACRQKLKRKLEQIAANNLPENKARILKERDTVVLITAKQPMTPEETYDGGRGKTFAQLAIEAGLPVQVGDDIIHKPKWKIPAPKPKMPEGLSYLQQLKWKADQTQSPKNQ